MNPQNHTCAVSADRLVRVLYDRGYKMQMKSRMIDIGKKRVTTREAVVEAKVFISPGVIKKIKKGEMPKGDVLGAARIAGIIASKKTASIIPLCHPIPIEYVDIDFSVSAKYIKITTTVKGEAKTGVEMEAFTATAVSALTVYDMCKGLDRGITISGLRLLKKSGGKSGTWGRFPSS